MSHRAFRAIALLVVLLWPSGSPGFAEGIERRTGSVNCRVGVLNSAARPAGVSRVVLADSGWSLGKYVASGGRARIVQICVAVMCIALFILMRKLR